MSLWLNSREIARTYEINRVSLSVAVNIYRKTYGEYPSWRMEGADDILYDIGYFLTLDEYEHKLRTLVTAPEGLYFTLTELYGLNDTQIGQYIAKFTDKSALAYAVYLGCGLWSQSFNERLLTLRTKDITESALYDVAKYGRKLLQIMINKQGDKPWEEYYESLA